MNLKYFRYLLISLIGFCTVIRAAEHHSDSWSSNRVDMLSRRGDLIAHVRVARVDYVRKPTKTENGNIVADIFSFGRLVTLDVVNIYEAKKLDKLSRFYIFQKGAVAGLEQARLDEGEEYIAFLKQSPPPGIAEDGTETVPELPRSPYYSLLQKRKGALAKDRTNLFFRVEQELRTRSAFKTSD